MVNIRIHFAGDAKVYDLDKTIKAVINDWMANIITDTDLIDLLNQFKIMKNRGMPSVYFLKDLMSDDMLETHAWFQDYGVGYHDHSYEHSHF